jgi:aryl-phospho-beta-D-glucosidase BglC (GH1 family)
MKHQQQYRSSSLSRTTLAVLVTAVLVAACSTHAGGGEGPAGSGGTISGTGGSEPIPDASGGSGGQASTNPISTGGLAMTGGTSALGGSDGPPSTGGRPAVGGAGGTGGGNAGAGGSGGSVRPDGGAIDDAAGAADAPNAEAGPAPPGGFLQVEGNKLLDWRGKTVRLTGVNWFGLETNNQEPHGIWTRDYRSMVKQIAALGFNTIRLPWANQILRSGAQASDAKSFGQSGPDPYDQTNPINAGLVGKSPLEIMDKVIEAAGELGVKIILDNHSREPDGYMNEQVWYTDKTSEKQWIDDWVFLAKRYAGNPTVVAADLDNEPHGIASWGTGDQTTDWNSAAERCGNAILAANADWLIVVEGVEKVGSDGYWWGGNLVGVKTNPIKLSNPKKLMYSTHEYGPEVHDQPWFSDASFPNNLPALWTSKFDFIMQQNLGHILLGEFGIKDRKAAGGKAGLWFDKVLSTLGRSYSWTFWCWNPNSGDTEGLLAYDWVTPVQWKIEALSGALAPMIGK